ncbi:MAG TPA: hypothetical protein VGH32_06085 [Pirellulales bacterium]
MLVHAVDRPDLAPLRMPERFRTDVAYFMTPGGRQGTDKLPHGEYWIRLDDARKWLDEGVLSVVSPLDSSNQTEFELTDEQENWLRWMLENELERIRLE